MRPLPPVSLRVGLHEWIDSAFHAFSGSPCFRIYGKGRAESRFTTIDVFATERRNRNGRWPFFRGTCITWTADAIAVGWDFAESFLREQLREPATRENPLTVTAGRLGDGSRRQTAGGSYYPTVGEVMAHECGHTAQARRMGGLYWLIGAMCTLFREGHGWLHHFENQASEIGVLGGIVEDSICPRLLQKVMG